MNEVSLYNELANVTLKLSDAYEHIGLYKEHIDVLEGEREDLIEGNANLAEDNEDLIRQVDRYGALYAELADLVSSVDEASFNLIMQALEASIPQAAIPDFVGVVKRLVTLLYEKGVEIKESEYDIEDEEEGIIYG